MELDARVATLAALADPARLRIVDLLGQGDASPGELRRELGVASNLLAHHLSVLEGAASSADTALTPTVAAPTSGTTPRH